MSGIYIKCPFDNVGLIKREGREGDGESSNIRLKTAVITLRPSDLPHSGVFSHLSAITPASRHLFFRAVISAQKTKETSRNVTETLTHLR